MYLKRVEICGFKSFADKTKLDFEPGITAIIGPNGCGKSNVADAVRWCLGEQSAHSLRSKQMMDVIFNGSQSRAVTGMAEVSITFDNSQNMLPIDYSEVTVTRRLFRSGESEYYLNKTQCRLKDIKDLFLDTGIATEGYSVMEQGKVEFILSSKPEERRELFEEAAGVAKYKVRREESLRKLEKVDIDMNRVNDMLAMLKEQISSLDAAARKARQYKKYQEDLKRLEIAHLVKSISSHQTEIENIDTELLPKTEEFEKYNTALNQIDSEISQIRLLQTEKDEIYIKMQDELSNIKSEINLADERIQQADIREKELIERQIVIENEISVSHDRIQKHETDIASINQLCSDLAASVVELEKQYLEKENGLNAIREELFNANKEENDFKTRLFEISSEKSRIHNEKNRLNSLQSHCQAQIMSYQKDLNRINEKLTPLNEQIAQVENELQSSQNNSAQMLEQQESLKNRIASLDSEKNLLSDNMQALKEIIVSIESKRKTLLEIESSDPKKSAAMSVLSLGIPGISGPISSLIRIENGAEDTVLEALGDKLNYLVSDTIENANKAINYLKESNLGRATFVVLERLSDNMPGNTVSELVGTRPLMSYIKYDASFEKAMKFICGETLVSGDTIYGNAIIHGGGLIILDEKMRINSSMFSQMEMESQVRKDELVQLTDAQKNIFMNLESIIEQKNKLDGELHRLTFQIEMQNSQISTLKQNAHYMQKEIELTAEELKKSETDENSATESLKSLDEKLVSFENEETGIKDKQQQMINRLAELNQEENKLAPALTEAKVAWATQLNELNGRKREEESAKENLQNINQSLELYKREFESNKLKIEDQKNTQDSESEKLKGLYARQEEKDVEVQASLKERQTLINEITEKNNVLTELKHTTEVLKQEMHRYELDKHSAQMKKDNSMQRLKEEYESAYDEVKEEYSAVQVQEEEIQRLKRRIESIGPVNLAAPEEYANLEERYNFLLTQQQDLVKAKEDLHQVITKINMNTRENFKNTFYVVQENFRKIYSQLFEGGEADLILTDENNLLETGVDIMAQPPGKKFQNMVLLSGGEKALTAIALLFAFFMVRPSPFCILDEVDAPLDEANIGRFVKMVKIFSEKSQFLVVTHNKRTMEMANVLYGVTMEELGVSKIISVRLQKELSVNA